MRDGEAVRIRLEPGFAGSSLSGTIESLVAAADKLGLPVVCSFNGVQLTAEPGASPLEVELQYDRDVRFNARLDRAVAAGKGESY